MSSQTGIAIAIAWPEFVGKQTGTWYDKPMTFLGFNKEFHYRVGHASLVLIQKEEGVCRYFDCGRYHAPYQYGRIRDESTDAPLQIQTRALWDGKALKNFKEILQEIQSNPWTFGMGPLTASYCEVNYESAFEKVKSMQGMGSIPFGPFTLNGTNCCRFVRTGLLAGAPKLPWWRKSLLNYFWHLKPMPITNVDLLMNKHLIPYDESVSSGKYHSTGAYSWDTVHGTLPQPAKPESIPFQSQWLAGEVAGSWFNLQEEPHGYRISRFSPEGVLECSGIFENNSIHSFSIDEPYEFTHLSHCNQVTVMQKGHAIVMQRIQ
ncbi:MAG: hypothetical protein HWE15_00075 [Algoriphagus sp.]|uniref:DUF6695 family protein n=1 Tax=Algoriphagus sp. TaxID=1872435 RepID=UPI00180348D2|nr:DUF6695 family protein [Algoriphagus sp.]NVJ84668.1 hypothetical protein [Algoriphagus sp.]